jgi:hypothetical protein
MNHKPTSGNLEIEIKKQFLSRIEIEINLIFSEKTAEGFVIWPKTGHYGHFQQERYLHENFFLFQNEIQPINVI